MTRGQLLKEEALHQVPRKKGMHASDDVPRELRGFCIDPEGEEPEPDLGGGTTAYFGSCSSPFGGWLQMPTSPAFTVFGSFAAIMTDNDTAAHTSPSAQLCIGSTAEGKACC